MRPTYERGEDVTREAGVADRLSGIWRCDLLKTPPKAPFDYVAVRSNEVKALVEIKTRTNPHGQYPTYMISAEKVHNCVMRSITYDAPFYLVVQFTDCLMYWPSATDQYTVQIGGRTDRNDKQDTEPVCHIPMQHFRKISK